MKFSIVIPTYNGEKFVRFAIESAINQTRKADEIIVSDDNSNDGTLEICKEYEDKVKIFINPDGPSGFVKGWNNAITHANSEFISILHQDDLLDETFLEEAERILVNNPDVKHFFVPCHYINDKGEILRDSTHCTGEVKRLEGSEYVVAYRTEGEPKMHRCPGVITHRDIFKKCSYREEAGHIADDDFFYRVANFTPVIGLLKPLASYREHAGSETGHLKPNQITKRLLHDYNYQLNNVKSNPLIDEATLKSFKYWKWKYFRRLIGYGIKNMNLADIIYALKQI